MDARFYMWIETMYTHTKNITHKTFHVQYTLYGLLKLYQFTSCDYTLHSY